MNSQKDKNENIDEKINRVREWIKKYPDLQITQSINVISQKVKRQLIQIARAEKIDEETFINQYKQIRIDKTYLIIQLREHKLSKKQEELVKEIKDAKPLKSNINSRWNQKIGEVNIDKGIEDLVKWCKQYPEVNITTSYSNSQKNRIRLKKYADREESNLQKLSTEYSKMQKYRQFLKENFNELTEEQKNKLKEANLGNIFGYSKEIEKLHEEYGLSYGKLKYIINRFNSMDEFIKKYYEGNLEREDYMELQGNFVRKVSVQEKTSKYIENIIDEVFKTMFSNGSEILVYDSDRLEQFIEELDISQKSVLKRIFGFKNGEINRQHDVAEQLGISPAEVSRNKKKILGLLKNNCRLYSFIVREKDVGRFFNKFVEGSAVFIADEKVQKGQPKIKRDELKKFCGKVWEQGIKDEIENKLESENDKIDYYINEIEKWNEKYPNAKIYPQYKVQGKCMKALKRYAIQENINYDKLLQKYQKMQEYCRTLIEKNEKGQVNQEQAKMIERLKLIKKKDSINIGECINEISQWVRNYPDVKITENSEISKEDEERLKKYSEDEKIDYEKLIEKYRKIQNYYTYLKGIQQTKNFTKKEIELITNKDLSELFDIKDEFGELSGKYGLKRNKIKYILESFSSMEEFIESYMMGKLKKEDCEILQKNFIKMIDIDENPSKYIENIMEKVLETMPKNNAEIIIYDGNRVRQFIETLNSEEKDILEMLFGYEDGEVKMQKTVADQLEMSRSYVQKQISKILYMLENNINTYVIKVSEKNIGRFFEEFVEGDTFFISDEKYEKKQPKIKMEELRKFCAKKLGNRKNEDKEIDTGESKLERLSKQYALISGRLGRIQNYMPVAKEILELYTNGDAKELT